MDLALRHHVFSSVGGYKTLYASPGLPRDLADDLESFARRIYRRVSGPPIRCTLRLADGTHCETKIFRNGSDHVGRPRSCVHTVIVSRDQIAAVPFLSPLELDGGYFLQADSDLRGIAGRLTRHLAIDPAERPRLAPLIDALEQGAQVEPLLRAMLSVHHGIIVRDPHDAAFPQIQMLLALLPPGVRAGFSVVRGAYLPVLERCPRVNVYFLSADNDLGPYAQQANFIVFDFADPKAPRIQNLPAANAYCAYLDEEFLKARRIDRIERVLALLERYDPGLAPSNDVYYNLAAGLRSIHDALDEAGAIDRDKLDESCPAGLDSVLPFWQAGMMGLAIYVLSEHCHVAERRFGAQSLRGVWEKVDVLAREKDRSNPERAAPAVGLLVDLLKNSLERGAGGVGDSLALPPSSPPPLPDSTDETAPDELTLGGIQSTGNPPEEGTLDESDPDDALDELTLGGLHTLERQREESTLDEFNLDG